MKLAVILVAGGGTRMSGYTQSRPKCMIEVSGKTLLERMLNILGKAGVKQTVLVVGYQSDFIKNTIGEIWDFMEIKYVKNKEWEETNNIVSLNLALDFIEKDFLLLEGDLIFTWEAFKPLLKPNRIAVDVFQNYMNGTYVTCDGKGWLKQMYLKSTQAKPNPNEIRYKTVNIYSFKKSSFFNAVVPRLKSLIEKGYRQIYYEKAIADAVKDRDLILKCIKFTGTPWYEIDTIEDLKKAEKLFSKYKS